MSTYLNEVRNSLLMEQKKFQDLWESCVSDVIFNDENITHREYLLFATELYAARLEIKLMEKDGLI